MTKAAAGRRQASAWSRWRPRPLVLAASACCVGIGASSEALAQAPAEPQSVEVTAPRVRVVTPLPGVVLERDRTATNVQSATAKDLRQAQSVSLTDFLNGQLQSVSVNDYQGNPYQQDLVFRGFAASPLIGHPRASRFTWTVCVSTSRLVRWSIGTCCR